MIWLKGLFADSSMLAYVQHGASFLGPSRPDMVLTASLDNGIVQVLWSMHIFTLDVGSIEDLLSSAD